MNETILRAEKLKAFYVLDMHGTQKVIKAVNEVDLEIRENEVYGIAGESGCGKTTLLKALFAAIEPPLRLMGGKVYYRWYGDEIDARALSQEGNEIEITALSPEEKRRLRLEFASYVPQGSMSVLNPVLKVKETYRDFLASHVSGKTKEEAFEIAKRHIAELGLPRNILEAYPHQLSGGMRQRVTIALATILKPRIIICDEPTTALDVVVQRGVVQLLKDIQQNLENTIVLVTHDMGVQANIADRIGIMYAGKMVEEATTEKIYDEPFHPYTRYLINSLPKFGDKSVRESVPGSPPSLSNLPSGCSFHPRCPRVMDICTKQTPDLTGLGLNHRVACWLAGDGENAKAS
jgi:peptide/nickel transport system ATP-binding protein